MPSSTALLAEDHAGAGVRRQATLIQPPLHGLEQGRNLSQTGTSLRPEGSQHYF